MVRRQAVLEDRRAKKILLCPPAKPLIDQIETIANALRLELFTGVDEADLEVCMRVHAKILGNLEKP
ncbi:transcriptional regulator SlyA [compost metagenome]